MDYAKPERWCADRVHGWTFLAGVCAAILYAQEPPTLWVLPCGIAVINAVYWMRAWAREG
jgi:hypothetical protein